MARSSASDDRYFEGNREAWRALEEAYEAGKLRAIGVSNFEREDIDNILGACTVKPMVNQILAHISNTPHELIRYTQEQGILVEAYSPIAHGELLKNEQVARDRRASTACTVPQLSIRYTLQLGLLPLPKTANPEHMRTNADVDFEISDEDMETLEERRRRSQTTASTARSPSLRDPHLSPDPALRQGKARKCGPFSIAGAGFEPATSGL